MKRLILVLIISVLFMAGCLGAITREGINESLEELNRDYCCECYGCHEKGDK